MWLTKNSDAFSLGSYFHHESIVLLMAYSGLLLDLLIIPALLFKKTRTVGFLIITLFHVLNSQLFIIDIFPWFMIAATTLFFNTNWLRKYINFFSRNNNAWPQILVSKEKLLAPKIITQKNKIILVLLFILIVTQLFLPLRHFLFSGNVLWTEEGQKFAWQMKLRTKQVIAFYIIKDKNSGKVYDINVNEYLKPWQREAMEDKPNLIWQFGQIVKKDFKKRNIDISFFANINASLNGRKFQPLIDTTFDLTSVPYEIFSHSKWVVSLKTPLNERLNENLEKNTTNVYE